MERDVSAQTFQNVKYERVPSLAMNNYSGLFATKDTDRFEKYIEQVAQGKKRISGATLLPSTLIHQAIEAGEPAGGANAAKKMINQKLSEMQANVVDGQWKTLVQRIRDSGTLQSSIAVCDVSGSMTVPRFKDGTCPLDSSLGLSLLLAEVTEPPFGGAFIIFSQKPELVRVGGKDDSRTLKQKIDDMECADWGYNTDFVAVFEQLILPTAVQQKLKPEDMVKRIFVFSDMQFDQAGSGSKKWDTSYQRVQKKFKKAGYEMPELVFWNLAGGRAGYQPSNEEKGDETAPKPVTAAEKGTVLVSGYSQGQLKMFLENGQFDATEEEEEDAVEKGAGDQGDDEDAVVVGKKRKTDPIVMVKKAISHRAYQMLQVVD